MLYFPFDILLIQSLKSQNSNEVTKESFLAHRDGILTKPMLWEELHELRIKNICLNIN